MNAYKHTVEIVRRLLVAGIISRDEAAEILRPEQTPEQEEADA